MKKVALTGFLLIFTLWAYAYALTAQDLWPKVGGIECEQIESTGGYSINLTINQITYALTENRMFPIPPDGPPQHHDTLEVTFKIDNQTSETVSFEYSSTQRYDFIIRDDSGTEVYRWSYDKMFAQVVTRSELAPGESLVYKEAIELRDQDSNPLPPANYTIEGVHTAAHIEGVHTTAHNGNSALRQKAKVFFKINEEIIY